MDETTDKSAGKEAVLLGIFFDSNLGRNVCRFYGLPVCKLLQDKHYRTKDNIPWDNLIGFGSDRASVMLGCRNFSQLCSVQPHL